MFNWEKFIWFSIRKLSKKIDKLNNAENEQVFNEIDINYNNELQANLEKKKDLFNQNKVINMLTRKIQLYPSKLEVIQYQKRFGELYDQLNNVTEKSQKILGECNSKNQVVQLLEQKENAFTELKNFYNGFKKNSEKEQVKNTIINIYNPLVPMINNSNAKIKEMKSIIILNEEFVIILSNFCLNDDIEISLISSLSTFLSLLPFSSFLLSLKFSKSFSNKFMLIIT